MFHIAKKPIVDKIQNKNQQYSNAFLVILYNKEISHSSTLKSLFSFKNNHEKSIVVIWNNGPTILKEPYTKGDFLDNFDIEIVQTVENLGLGNIYNHFFDRINSQRYILLDDDSNLSDDYLLEINTIDENSAGAPIVYQNEKPCSLRINGVMFYNSDNRECEIENISAISSGLVLGLNFLKELKEIYGEPFDSRLFLYAVDTTFCCRINSAKLASRFKVLPKITHSLSEYEEESESLVNFRRFEHASAYGIVVRYYKPVHIKWRIFILHTLSFLVKLVLRRKDPVQLEFLRSFFTGEHYRQ